MDAKAPAVAQPHTVQLLVVEDDADTLACVAEVLSAQGYKVTTASSAEAALERCRAQTFHLVLADMQLPGLSGIALIRELRQACPATRCVLLTGHGSIRSAVVALKRGAVEYITKPVKPKRLIALCAALTTELPAYLPNKLFTGASPDVARCDTLLARSPAMRRTLDRVVQAAATHMPVLLTGEAGAGKEQVARAIHARSGRAAGPFVVLHTAAVPAELLAAELLGLDRPGAGDKARGKVELAAGGTLYLDEVAALDEPTQLLLLRLLDVGQFTRLNGKRDKVADVRVIVGTSREIHAMVQSCTFREDLYFRLNVFPIAVPALRERRDDVPVLAADLVTEISAKYGKPAVSIPVETERLLVGYDWPGNVRELRNVIEQAVLLARGGELSPSLLPQMLHKQPTAQLLQIPIGASMDSIEREVIMRTLEAHKGNKTAAAEALGISRRSIYNKLAEWDTRPSSRS